MKKLLIVLLLIIFQLQTTFSQPTKTQILWDNYGVPHIYAKNHCGDVLCLQLAGRRCTTTQTFCFSFTAWREEEGLNIGSGQWLSDDEIEQRL